MTEIPVITECMFFLLLRLVLAHPFIAIDTETVHFVFIGARVSQPVQ
jgi:uncharacterized integral membrane protein